MSTFILPTFLYAVKVEVLLLDRLAASKSTEGYATQCCIGARYDERKLTIFTANYPDTPRSGRYIWENLIGVLTVHQWAS